MQDQTYGAYPHSPSLRHLFIDDPFLDRVQQIQEAVESRAYELFEAGGKKDGSDREHWIAAQAQMLHPVPVEIAESENEIMVRAEVPGFGAKNLEIGVTPRQVYILGERPETLTRIENRPLGSTARPRLILCALDLPAKIDPENVTAAVYDGILDLVMSKAAVAPKPTVLAKAASA